MNTTGNLKNTRGRSNSITGCRTHHFILKATVTVWKMPLFGKPQTNLTNLKIRFKYLRKDTKPPKAYIDRIDKNIAILTHNNNIDKILNNPAVQIMGLLPGAG